MSPKKKLLLIGAGPTSALIRYNINRNPDLKNAIDIHVFEKSKGVGGRFSTSRSPNNPECYADLGAQYLTHTSSNSMSKPYFDNLTRNALIRPLETSGIPGFGSDINKTNYACIQGMSSIVKHFSQQGNVGEIDINFNCRVTEIKVVENGKVEVSTTSTGTSTFDAVISTIPVPQLLQLNNFSDLICNDTSIKRNLEAVKYSTRFALGVFCDTEVCFKQSAQPLNFLKDDPVYRYWSIENIKRTNCFTGPTSVVFHTSIDFGDKNKHEDKETLKPYLYKKAIEIVPEAATVPQEKVKSHKWLYSQVLDSYPGKPGFIELNQHVYAAGDGFVESGFEGCIASAEKMVMALIHATK